HELPTADSHRTIYMVRDGRAALVSHYHYLRDIRGIKTSLADVIKGTNAPSWSQHVNAWTLSGRPNVLTVRYEDLVRADPGVQEAIAAFVGRKPQRPFDVPFSRLNAMMPAFFRSGSNQSNIAELAPAQLHLFERLHGETMDALGYARLPVSPLP